MNTVKKDYLENLRKNAQLLFSMYAPGELEDCLFDVFEEANLHSDLSYEEKEKRKILHESLREIFRSANENKKINHKILNKCNTEIK
jgi:hypothetical protein